MLAAVAFVLAGRALSAAELDNVLLDFTAKWCGPCQQMNGIVSKLEREGLPIRKVDVDREPKLAAKYGVQSIPCFVLIGKGQEMDRANGTTSEQQLRSMLNRLPKSAPPVAQTPRDGEAPRLGEPIPITPPIRSNPRTPSQPDFEGGFAQTDPVDPPAHGPRAQSPDANPMRSSARIRVKDGTAINFGSATIIDSQPGKAILVSCGHIFRNLSKSAIIEVDVYANSKSAKPETVSGNVLLTDLDADVGLIGISYPHRLPCIPLAGLPLTKKDRLFSIGCSGGDNPSREDLELTAINRYEGPDNLECTKRPQKGRSGGGLFRDDELVGICIAADPKEPRGIYAGIQPVIVLLEKAGLGRLAPRSPKTPGEIPKDRAIADVMPDVFAESPSAPQKPPGRLSEGDVAEILARELDGGPGAAGSQEFAGAEIICIVRSRTPGEPSRVVIVNQASRGFVNDLLHESGNSDRPSALQNTAKRMDDAAPQGPIETSFEPKPFRRVRSK